MLGVDIGGVIVARVAGDADTSFFGTRPMDTPAVEGVIEVLRELTTGPFDGRVHLVSKAGPAMQDRTRRWLQHTGFHDSTRIPRDNVHFVLDRSRKAPVCEGLAVTHFVDDRLDVLTSLTSVPHKFLFVGGLGEKRPPREVPAEIRTASNWAALRRSIVESLPPSCVS